MIIKFDIADENITETVDKLTENAIKIERIFVNDVGNWSLTIIPENKHQVLIIAELYFG